MHVKIYICMYVYTYKYTYVLIYKFRYVRTVHFENAKLEAATPRVYVTHVSILIRFTDGLSRSSAFGGLPSTTGEWKSLRGSSRSLPS